VKLLFRIEQFVAGLISILAKEHGRVSNCVAHTFRDSKFDRDG
jgi:hypothetical protein